MVNEEKEFKSKYLDKGKLLSVDFEGLSNIEVSSNDTINEEELFEFIINSEYKDELMAATIQMAIVGFGGRQYNQYVFKGQQESLQELFVKAGVKYNNRISDTLDTNILTPRRLLRILRYQIQLYLEKKSRKVIIFIQQIWGL